MTGTKRASPGVDDAKNLLNSVEVSEQDAEKLANAQKEIQRVELVLERYAQEKLKPVFEKRRDIVKSIPKFWPVALMRHAMFALHAQHSADQSALEYLEDVWMSRDTTEPRCYTLEFHFKENPYFSDKVLKKEFKYVPQPATADDKPDENGITNAMLDFSWERDTKASTIKINWKSDDKALTKLYPRELGEDEDDEPFEGGSFFNFFEHEKDPYEIGVTIANEIFPEAIEYFLGTVGGDEIDSDSDSDDDDDDAEEIDLEKPKSKKQKV